MIDFVVGSDGGSRWEKFYVKGLERFQVAGEYASRGKGRWWRSYAAAPPDGAIFSAFYQAGSKWGAEEEDFYILEVGGECREIKPRRGLGCVCGSFKILCHGDGKTRAPRLMEWWNSRSPGRDREFALACADLLPRRGRKLPPDLDLPADRPSPISEDDRLLLRVLVERYGRDAIGEYVSRPEVGE